MTHVRTITTALFSAAVLCLGWQAAARAAEGQDQAPAYPLPRVGVVRIEEVFRQIDYIKEQEQVLRQEYEQDRARINSLQQQITEKQTELRQNPLITPQSPRFRKGMLEIQLMQVDLEEQYQQLRESLSKDTAEFWKSVYLQFQLAVKGYAEHYQLDLVITAPDAELAELEEREETPDRIQQQILMRRVQYLSPRIDITPQIIEMMNKEYQQRRAGGTGGL